jgi:thiosulfate reductase cytochrome b subunit
MTTRLASTVEGSGDLRGRAKPSPIHPLIVRFTHWINAAAMMVMILSGWQIHNAYPTLPFEFPRSITLGTPCLERCSGISRPCGLAANGLVYLAYGLTSGHFRGIA